MQQPWQSLPELNEPSPQTSLPCETRTHPERRRFIIQGDAADDRTGNSVASAGDVNGDGFDDLIVGALRGDDGGNAAGEAYVVFGAASGFGTDVGGRQVIDLTTLSAAEGFIIQGDAAGDFAISVSSVPTGTP